MAATDLPTTMGSPNPPSEDHGNRDQIYQLAEKCERLFENLLSVMSRKSSEHFRIVQEYQYRFERWAGYLGVFAAPHTSLDCRLEPTPNIRDMVIRLLVIVERNIQHGLRFETPKSEAPRSGEHESTEYPATGKMAEVNELPISPATKAALDGIREAIDSLHRLGTAIRKTSASKLTSRVRKFEQKDGQDHIFYDRIDLWIVKGLYPEITDSLARQLAGSVSFRRARLNYQRMHQKKLETRRARRREYSPEGSSLDDTAQLAQSEAQGKEKSSRKPNETQSMASSRFGASTVTDPTEVNSQFQQNFTADNALMKELSISGPMTVSSVVRDNPYPRPPKPFQERQKYCQCDWCFRELEVPEDKTVWKSVWKSHFKEDLEPYVCISEECSGQLKYFTSLKNWREHMNSVHTVDWMQEIHKPSIWYCDMGSHEYEEFADPRDLDQHLQEIHEEELTVNQRDTLVRRNVVPISRGCDICPLCGIDITVPPREPTPPPQLQEVPRQLEDSTAVTKPTRKARFELPDDPNSDQDETEPLGDVGSASDEENQSRVNHIKLTTHIAAHLKSLAFTSLRYFDDDSVSVGSQQAASGAETGELSTEEGRGDHYFDLDGSLTFDDVPSLDRGLPEESPDDYEEQISDPRASFPVGIEIWHDCPDAILDICFIHGLAGDRNSTWTGIGKSEPWPKTLLPPRLYKARIMTYGYDAYATRGPVTLPNQHTAHAVNLVMELTTDRISCKATSRPLIFIAHGLGGLVCKDAILYSRDSDSHLQDVYNCINGIFFVGTPHNRHWIDEWSKLPASVLGFKMPPSKTLWDILRMESESIKLIEFNFGLMVDTLPKFGRQLMLACFFEELPLPMGEMIVPKDSAVLADHGSFGIPANHIDMVKSSSAKESWFFYLLDRILIEQRRLLGAEIPETEEAEEAFAREAEATEIAEQEEDPVALTPEKALTEITTQRAETLAANEATAAEDTLPEKSTDPAFEEPTKEDTTPTYLPGGLINRSVARYEITEVYNHPEAKVDIVLVHGLNGRPDETWTAENGVFWPTDLLPTSLQDSHAYANIFVYGYNADVYSKRNDNADDEFISHHAQALVTSLTVYRKSENCSQNPIIWVCHSFGGILVKSALLYSDGQRGDNFEDYRSIYVSTFGIIFLGTPHQRLDGDILQLMSDSVTLKKAFRPESVLLRKLQRDHEKLASINVNFLDIFQRFRILMVHENHKTNVRGTETIVVDAVAAGPPLPGVIYYGIEANHSEMCKFNSPGARGYRTIATDICVWVKEAPSIIQVRWQVEEENRRAHARVVEEGFPPRESPHLDLTFGNTGQEPFEVHEPAPDEPPFTHPENFRPNSRFRGRERELFELHEMLMDRDRRSQGTSAVLIWAAPGGGKTCLAREYVFRHRSDYPGGIFWVYGKTRSDLEDGFLKIANSANLQASVRKKGIQVPDGSDLQDPSKAIPLVWNWLNESENWLLVLDNVLPDTPGLSECIPDTRNTSVIITSRDLSVSSQLRSSPPQTLKSGLPEHVLQLERLDEQDAQALLLEEMEKTIPWSQDDLSLALEAVRLLDCLPLAIHAAGKQLRATGESLSIFIRSYKSRPSFEQWGVYSGTYEKLQEHGEIAALNLMNLLSFFTTRVPVDLLALGRTALDKRTPIETKNSTGKGSLNNTLAVLIAFGLIEREEIEDDLSATTVRTSTTELIDVLRIHIMVQTFFLEKLKKEEQFSFWLERAAAVFCTSFDNGDLRTRMNQGVGIPDDFRTYATEGWKILEHIRLVEKPTPELQAAERALRNQLERIHKRISTPARTMTTGKTSNVSIFERRNSLADSSFIATTVPTASSKTPAPIARLDRRGAPGGREVPPDRPRSQ